MDGMLPEGGQGVRWRPEDLGQSGAVGAVLADSLGERPDARVAAFRHEGAIVLGLFPGRGLAQAVLVGAPGASPGRLGGGALEGASR
jgi:hypothetical protein